MSFFCQDLSVIVWQRCSRVLSRHHPTTCSSPWVSTARLQYITSPRMWTTKKVSLQRKVVGRVCGVAAVTQIKFGFCTRLFLSLIRYHWSSILPKPAPQPRGGFRISANALRDAVIHGQKNPLEQADWLSQTLSRTNRFPWSQLIRGDMVVCSHWRHSSSRWFSALTGEGL